MTCTWTDCDRSVVARRLCPRHYAQARRAGTLDQFDLVQPQPPHPRRDPEQRFLSHLRIAETVYDGTPCVVWDTVNAGRYARFYVSADDTKAVQAHRWAYERYVGPIPDGLVLDHLCRQTFCVNPRHLEPVTQLENTRRGIRSDQRRSHCKRGHELNPENVYVRPDTGSRQCRECIRLRNAGRAKPLELMAVAS